MFIGSICWRDTIKPFFYFCQKKHKLVQRVASGLVSHFEQPWFIMYNIHQKQDCAANCSVFLVFIFLMVRRGFIMGIWNSHTSVGNILGSLIAGVFVSSEWGMSFIVPGLIIAATGILCFFFLVESQFLQRVVLLCWINLFCFCL